MLLSMECNTWVWEEANLLMQFVPVIKNDNTRRKLPQTTSVEMAPNTMHLDMPSVQHGTLSATSVVTLDTGSQSVEEVPLPTNRMGKHNTLKKAKKHHGKKGHPDIIEMEEFDGQYDEVDVHFFLPWYG